MSTSTESGRAAETPPGAEAETLTPEERGWGDYVVPAVVFVFCGVVSGISLTLEEALPIMVGDSMQPRVFPIFLMVLIAVLNVALIVQILGRPLPRRLWEPRQTWVSALLLGVFYLLTEYVDIILALIAVMFTLCLVWGERRLWVAALVAVGTTVAIFFSFDLLLEVRFPRGLFTDWYYG